MAKTQRLVSIVLLLLLMPLLSSFASANNQPVQPQINAHWVADEFGETLHSYRVVFADDESYQALVDVEHNRNGELLPSEIFQSWDLIDGVRVLDIQLLQNKLI